MKGSCLCGAVTFEFEYTDGPFELCHCTRCRKASGSAYAAFLEVSTEGYRMLSGREHVSAYSAPVVEKPPAYTVRFCSLCGGPVPDPDPQGDTFEIPAGTVDDPLPRGPDKHIYVDLKAAWDDIGTSIPSFSKPIIIKACCSPMRRSY